MTLRYDEHGKPIGLDWNVCSDGTFRPEVWNWRAPATKERGGEDEPADSPNHSRKRLSPATEALIVRMYRDENKSARECALAAGVKPPTVFKVLGRNGVPSRGYHQTIRSVSPAQEADIIRLYSEELQSSGQISKTLGVSNRTVSRALARAGVPIRTASESAKLDRRRRAQRSA
jgi:DNA invertase Pin-like site-specific DNA recombinase